MAVGFPYLGRGPAAAGDLAVGTVAACTALLPRGETRFRSVYRVAKSKDLRDLPHDRPLLLWIDCGERTDEALFGSDEGLRALEGHVDLLLTGDGC